MELSFEDCKDILVSLIFYLFICSYCPMYIDLVIFDCAYGKDGAIRGIFSCKNDLFGLYLTNIITESKDAPL